MFKFMITEDSEIIFYDTESHLIFSFGLCIAKMKKNWHDPLYQIINPVSFLINAFIDNNMASYEEQFDQDLKNTHIQLSNWIANGIGYPRIYNNYFDEEKIFKNGNYHSMNTTDALWSLQSSMSTIFSGKLENKIDSLNSQLFKTLRCPALGYIPTAANVALKSLSIMYPENYSILNGTVLYIMNQYTNTAQYPVIDINGTGVTIYHGAQAEPVATTNLELAGEANKILAYYYFVDTSGSTEIPMLIYLGSSSISSEFVKKTGDIMTGNLIIRNKNLIIGHPENHINNERSTLNIGGLPYSINAGEEDPNGAPNISTGINSVATGMNSYAFGPNSLSQGAGGLAIGEGSHIEGSGSYTTGYDCGHITLSTYNIQNKQYTIGGTSSEINAFFDNIDTYSSEGLIVLEESESNSMVPVYSYIANVNAEAGTITLSDQLEYGTQSFTNKSAWWFNSEYYKIASGSGSHIEGAAHIASGLYSHAEGDSTIASEYASHAEGIGSIASGECSHAEGFYTTSQRKSQHTEGEYNILDNSGTTSTRGTYAHIVGNGASNNTRSNAHTLDWSGNAWFAGDVYTGSTSGTNKDSGSKKLATEDSLNNYVTLNTAQTVAGEKTFTQPIGVTTAATIEYNATENCIEFNFD